MSRFRRLLICMTILLHKNIIYRRNHICPIGQEQYAAELQFRIAAPQGTKFWDPTNDFSYQGLTRELAKTKYMPVFDGATKIFGEVPGGFEPVPSPSPTPAQYKVGDLTVTEWLIQLTV